MPTVIDELVLELGLDIQALKVGREQTERELKRLRDDAARTGTQIEKDAAKNQATGRRLSQEEERESRERLKRNKEVLESFAAIRNQVLGLIGILVGGRGLSTFIGDSVTQLSGLGRAAQNIGIGVPELAALQMAVQRIGGTAEEVTQSLQGIATAAEDFRIRGGASQFIQFLQPIGARPGESPFQIYMDFVRFAEQHKGDKDFAQKIMFIGRGLGLSQGMIQEAMRGQAQVMRDLMESYQLGTPTREMTERMQQLQHDFGALGQSAEHLGQVMLTSVQPQLSAVLTWVTHFIEQEPKAAAAITAFVTAWTGLRTLNALGLGKILGLDAVETQLNTILALLLRIASGGGVLPFLTTLLAPNESIQGGDAETQALRQSIAEENARRQKENAERRAHGQPELPMLPMPAPQPSGGQLSREIFEQGGTDPGALTRAPPLLPAQRQQNMETARAYFLSQGYSVAQTAGILANLFAESGFNPRATGDPDAQGYPTSFGIAQWHNDRVALFNRWADERGLPHLAHADLMEQLQFIQWELTQGPESATGRQLRATNDPRQAGAIFSRGYERPANREGEAYRRGELAPQFLMPVPPIPPAQAPPAFGPRQRPQDQTAPVTNGPVAPIAPEHGIPPSAPPITLGLPPIPVIPPAAPVSSNTSSNVTVGAITVNSQATDAQGIARDLRFAISEQMVALSNRGLS